VPDESDGAAADRKDAERKEYSRLRSLLIEPGNVYITRAEGCIWLTDKYVVLDATGFSSVRELEPRWYRIVASGANAGFREPDKKTSAENETAVWHLNIARWLKEIRERDYRPVIPTGISFTDSQAKAFLLFAEIAEPEPEDIPAPSAVVMEAGHIRFRVPLAMHEDVWQGFRLAWPDATLSHPGYADPFRISIPGNGDLAYVYGVAIPERLHKIVLAIVEAYDDRGNERGTEAPEGHGDNL
jgi:hypothetical protein